jgi:hypothetical protein
MFLLDHPPQIAQTFGNPLQPGGLPPMFFRGEINDPPRAAKGAGFRDKHPANPDLMPFASIFVSKEVGRECLFEHQSDSLAHHTHRVDGVHQRLNRRFEKIALDESHHLIRPASRGRYPQKIPLDFAVTARQNILNAVFRRWTARKGWRETGPERGLFILQPNFSVSLHLPQPFMIVELALYSLHDLFAEYTSGVGNQAFLQLPEPNP